MTERDLLDHKGLIRDAYRMDGITWNECRSIFLDWALSLPDGMEARDGIERLLGLYAPGAPDHPMTLVLKEGLHAAQRPRRRGGWRTRKR